MNLEKLLLISNDKAKIEKLKGQLEHEFTLFIATTTNAETFLANDPSITSALYDLTVNEAAGIREYLVFRLRHDEMKIITLVSGEFYKKLVENNIERRFWCYDCLSEETLLNKTLEFKQILFSEKQKSGIIRAIFEQANFGLAIFPSKGINHAILNDEFLNIVGYDEEEYKALGWNGITYEADKHLDRELVENINAGQTIAQFQKRIIRKDGTIIWIEQQVNVLRNVVSKDFLTIITIRNIEERKALEEQLMETDRSRVTLLNNIPGLAYRCDNDENWTMRFVSDGCEALTGFKPKELIDNKIISFASLILRKYDEGIRKEWDRVITQGGIFQYQYEIKTKGNQIKWVYERGVPVRNGDGEIIALEGIIIDISYSKKLERQLQYFNEFNQKLRLPNREFLKKKIQARVDMKYSSGTIFLINLKDAQKLYRSHGYEYVELLTSSLVNKLRALENSERTLYYAEENIYVFFTKKAHTEAQIKICYQDIYEAVKNTIIREQINCNVGVAHLDRSSVYAEDYLQRARVASELTRDENKLINLYVYDTETEDKIKRENTLKQELIDVSYEAGFGKLRLVFQPLIKLESGKISGFEALARYTSEQYGHISPLEFIPIVEKNRLIVAFGKKIIDLAINFIKSLMAAGFMDLPVSVNISTLQLLDSEFVPLLLAKLEAANVPPTLFHIELTETIFATNFDLLNDRLDALIAAGVEVGLDDFGTGFSSLSRIEELRFNLVKIDKSFIQKLTPENINLSTIPEIINICQKFNLSSLAEGIETKEQYELLNNLGCKYGQGYYMSRPLEKDDALMFAKTNLAND